MEQRTEEWFATRCGKITASAAHDIIAKTKSGYSAGRKNYITKLLLERLTGHAEEGFTNAAMQWGVEQEPFARKRYEFLNDVEVEEIGFVDHPHLPMVGASPDGLVGTDGLIEIKCPNSATHIATLKGGAIAAKYQTQMTLQMACTGREWCDFVSFDPRFPEALQYHCQRFYRDDLRVQELQDEIKKFNEQLEADLAELQKIGG